MRLANEVVVALIVIGAGILMVGLLTGHLTPTLHIGHP